MELKAVEQVLGIHHAQLLTYMKLAGIRTGLLINSTCPCSKTASSALSCANLFVPFVVLHLLVGRETVHRGDVQGLERALGTA